MKNTVYVVVRKTEDQDFYDVNVFRCVCATKEAAERAIKQFKENFGPDDLEFEKLEILERELKE